MRKSTKDVIIGCVLTAVLSIPTTIIGTREYNIKSQQNQEQNQSIIVNIDGRDVSFQSQDIEELNNKISEAEIKNKELEQYINKLKNSNAQPKNNTNEQNITYLNELQVFNCQYYDRDSWQSDDIPEWTISDKAADGNTYKNATHMTVHGSLAGCAQIIVIDYLLDQNYKILNGNFMLDELSKSTTSIATLNIYGDDNLIYTFENVTGGLVPQNTGDISVENINKLRFEFISKQGELGNQHFGVVFYDTILR